MRLRKRKLLTFQGMVFEKLEEIVFLLDKILTLRVRINLAGSLRAALELRREFRDPPVVRGARGRARGRARRGAGAPVACQLKGEMTARNRTIRTFLFFFTGQ